MTDSPKNSKNSSHNPINKNNLIQIVPDDSFSKSSHKRKKRNYLLKLTNRLYDDLGQMDDINNHDVCEKYRRILRKLKYHLDTIPTEMLEKCEKQLNELAVKINREQKFENNIKGSITNSDLNRSAPIDLTIDEDNVENLASSNFSALIDSDDAQPDSTVLDEEASHIELKTKSSESRKSRTNDYCTENEVSSSGVNITSPPSPDNRSINSPCHNSSIALSEKPFREIIKLDELQRHLKMLSKTQKLTVPNALDTTKNISQKVADIMQMAKENAEKVFEENDFEENLINHSSRSNFYPSANKEELLNEVLTNLNSKSPEVSEEVIDVFSDNYINGDKTVQAQFEWNEKTKIEITTNLHLNKIHNTYSNADYLCAVSEKELPVPNHLLKGKLSDALEKMMHVSENVERRQPETSKLNIENKTVEKPILSSVSNTKLTEANVGINNDSKASIRGKLTQEITLMHKAGDGSKILGSLKKLKNDPKKLSGPSENVVINPFIQKCVESQFCSSPRENERTNKTNLRRPVSGNVSNSFQLRVIQSENSIEPLTSFRRSDPRLGANNKFSNDNDLNAKSSFDKRISVVDTEIPSPLRVNVRPFENSKQSITCGDKSKDERPYLKKPFSQFQKLKMKKKYSRIQFSNKCNRNSLSDTKHNKFQKTKRIYEISDKKVSNEKDNNKIKIREDDPLLKVNEQTEFSSPLANIYPDTSVSKMNKVYRRPSFNSRLKFKIPKVKTSVSLNEKPSNKVSINKTDVSIKDTNQVELSVASAELSDANDKQNKKTNLNRKKKKLINSNFSNNLNHDLKINKQFYFDKVRKKIRRISEENPKNNEETEFENVGDICDVTRKNQSRNIFPRETDIHKVSNKTVLQVVKRNQNTSNIFPKQLKNKFSKVNDDENTLDTIELDNDFIFENDQEFSDNSIEITEETKSSRSKINSKQLSQSFEFGPQKNVLVNIPEFSAKQDKQKNRNSKNLFFSQNISDSNAVIEDLKFDYTILNESEDKKFFKQENELLESQSHGETRSFLIESKNVEENKKDSSVKDDEFLSRLISIPSLRKIVENTNLRGEKLYIHLLSELNPEQFRLVQEALKSEHLLDVNEQNIDVKRSSDEKEKRETNESNWKKFSLDQNEKSVSDDSKQTIPVDEMWLDTSFSKESIPSLNEKKIDQKTSSANRGKNRKRITELDRLHADIKKMKHTKNNIFTAIGTRSCRLQTPVYTDHYPKKGTKGDKLKCSIRRDRFADDSGTDSEEEILSGRMCRSKEKNLGYDSDDSLNFNIQNQRKRSKVFWESSSDTNSDAKKTDRKKKARSLKFVKSLKQKACPKSVKIKLYGKEAVAADHDTCYPELQVVLYNLSKKNIEEALKFSTSQLETEASMSFSNDRSENNISETNQDFASYVIVQNPKTVSTTSKTCPSVNEDNGNANSNELGINLKNQVTEKIKLKKMSPLNKEEIQLNLKNDQRNLTKKKRKRRKKGKTFKEKKPRLDNHIVLNENASTVDVSMISQDETLLETSRMEMDINERISKLPERNAFKNNVRSINLMFIEIESRYSKLLYKCNTNQCDYDTYDVEMFANHLSFLHKDVIWDGACSLCNQSCDASDLIDGLSHLMHEHLIMTSLVTEKPVEITADSRTVKIKTEPEEFRIPNNELIFSICDEFCENGISVENDSCERRSTKNIPCEEGLTLRNFVQSPELTRSIPRIRVRRLSGDQLSGKVKNLNLTSEVPVFTSELEKNCDNTGSFAFVISDVKTISRNNISTDLEILDRDHVLENIANKTSQNFSELVNASDIENIEIGMEKKNQNDEISENIIFPTPVAGDPKSTVKTTQAYSSYARLNLDDWHMMNLYKCNGPECLYSVNTAEEFRNHLCTVHKQTKKKRQRKVDAIFLKCLYCSNSCPTPELLTDHIFDVHRYCHYQCPYCVFRACRPVYIIWHLQNNHSEEHRKINVMNLNDNFTDITSYSDKRQSLSAVIPSLKCTLGCAYETLSIGEFVDHIKKFHGQVQTLKCHLCPHVCFKLDSLLKHYNLHYIAEFQCIYCLRGFASIDAMKSHLLLLHPFLFPKAVKRADQAQSSSDSIWSRYLLNLDFDEPIDNLRNVLNIVKPSNDSVITLYRDDESVTSDAVKATGHHILNKGNQYVLNYGCDTSLPINVTSEQERITDEINTAVSAIMPNSEIISTQNSMSSTSSSSLMSLLLNAAVSTKSNFMESEIDCRISGGNKLSSNKKPKKTNNLSIIGLTGKDLYRCGMTGCNMATEDYHSFKEHMFTCDNARNTTYPTCPHCKRSFQKNANFFDHICLHATPRFYCTMCDFKYTTAKKVVDHMRTHKVIKSKTIPADPLKDNKYSDIYLVVPDIDRKSRGPQKFVKTPVKEPLAPFTTKITTSIKYQATTVYSCDDIEKLGPMQLFTVPIGCGICNKYSTKVRTNILYHLKSHELGLTTNTDIVNPVPRTEKNELMFNKMTNHAAYTVKADDKKNNLQTKIEKIEEIDGNKNSIIPEFVPKIYRFSCGAPGCNYVTQDGNGLKNHFETLHNELNNFSCPHCGCSVSILKINSHFRYHNSKLFKCCYCDYVHYQRDSIEKHQNEKHTGNNVSVQIIREMEPDEVDKLNVEARSNFSISLNKNSDTSLVNCWKCNLCRCGTLSTEESMKRHCLMNHRINNKYKCCLCSFSSDVKELVTSHLKNAHGMISHVVVTIYKKMNELEDPSSPASLPVQNDTSVKVPSDAAFKMSSLKDLSEENSTDIRLNKKVETGNCEIPVTAVEEGNNMFVQPYPDGNFRCPRCIDFQTTSLEEMRDHIFAEENYVRYVCTVCGIVGVNKRDLKRHLENEKNSHGETNENNIQTLTLDNDFEKKVLQALNYQLNKIKQITNELKVKHNQCNSSVTSNSEVIEISDSSDEEAPDSSNVREDYLQR